MSTVLNNSGFKFPKEEKLHHRSLVNGLFSKGKSFFEFPFRAAWRPVSHDELTKNFRNIVPPGIGKVQFLVTVPKKKRKKAVDRVLMRRRIKEAYRLNKHMLQAAALKDDDLATLSVAIIYSHDKNLEFKTVEEKMKNVISKISQKLEKCQES